MSLLAEAVALLAFLIVDEAVFQIEPGAAEKQLGAPAGPVLVAAVAALAPLPTWRASDLEAALRAALVDGLGLKPKNAFGPVRVAVTGRTVSPPLFESMELLGRERSLARLERARAAVRADTGSVGGDRPGGLS